MASAARSMLGRSWAQYPAYPQKTEGAVASLKKDTDGKKVSRCCLVGKYALCSVVLPPLQPLFFVCTISTLSHAFAVHQGEGAVRMDGFKAFHAH